MAILLTTIYTNTWLDKPDGQPGWAAAFLRMDYSVVIVDLPLHGRSATGTAVTTDAMDNQRAENWT